MKIMVVTAFDSRCDRKLVEEGMKSRVLLSRVVPQALDRSMDDTFMGESELDRSRNKSVWISETRDRGERLVEIGPHS